MISERVVLITGANSGVGYGLVERLIEEQSRPNHQNESLIIVFACRSRSKAQLAIKNLFLKYHSILKNEDSLSNIKMELLLVDLSLPLDVHRACLEFKQRFQRLDVLYANAGILPIDGIDWVNGPLNLFKNPLRFFTDVSGTLKQSQGMLVPLQNTQLGMVFAANVFGHFLMIRELQDVLHNSDGKIIWTGSHTAEPSFFNWNDIQAIHSSYPYESSKFLTKLLCNELNQEYQTKGRSIQVYVADPGVVSTSIISASSINWLIQYLLIVPVLFIASLVMSSITFTPTNAAESLLKLGEKENLSSTDYQYASRHSWIKGRFVVKKPLLVSGQKEKRAVIQELEELRKSFLNGG